MIKFCKYTFHSYKIVAFFFVKRRKFEYGYTVGYLQVKAAEFQYHMYSVS